MPNGHYSLLAKQQVLLGDALQESSLPTPLERCGQDHQRRRVYAQACVDNMVIMEIRIDCHGASE